MTTPAPPARPVAVTAAGWGWRYATRRAWAVRGLDLDVAAGSRVLLLGASGSGKSTLLAGLAGLLDPGPAGRPRDGIGEQEGQLLLDGVPVRSPGAPTAGLVLQDPSTQTVLGRCGDDVAFGLENHAVPPAEIWPRVDAALAAVRFPYPRSRPTSALSGGERQRLALAGALALRPGLLLLDEPTAMLDPDGATALRSSVADVLEATGATCLLVEHRVAGWLPLVDRVVVLDPGGGVRADGSPREVLRDHGAELAASGIWIPGHAPRPAAPAPGAAARGATGGEVLLRAEDLAVAPHGPGRRALPRPVLSGVHVDLRGGQITCLVGPNGAGKTTLAHALAGLTRPLAGSVRALPGLAVADGDDAGPDPGRWPARRLVRRIGSVFQDPGHQVVATTVAAELAVGPRRIGLPESEVQGRVEALLTRLRLAHLARANPFTLSGGEQRRLSVATALATSPRLLVLDEPTFGQDAVTWRHLVELLLALACEGSAVVAVTHDDALVDACTAAGSMRVLRVEAGRVRDVQEVP